jgi:hypothetical protein
MTVTAPQFVVGSVSSQPSVLRKIPVSRSCFWTRNEGKCGRRDTPSLFLNVDTKWKWSASRPSRSTYGKRASGTADKVRGLHLYNPLQGSSRIFILISQGYAVRKPIARLVQALKLIPFPLKAPLLQTSLKKPEQANGPCFIPLNWPCKTTVRETCSF